jgi:hypothetical protein
MSKELGITIGKVAFKKWDGEKWPEKRWSIGLDETNGKAICISPRYDFETPESEANANLIADAFNTANKCNLLPSELLEENNKLKEANEELLDGLKMLFDFPQEDLEAWSEYDGFTQVTFQPTDFKKVCELIKKHSTK